MSPVVRQALSDIFHRYATVSVGSDSPPERAMSPRDFQRYNLARTLAYHYMALQEVQEMFTHYADAPASTLPLDGFLRLYRDTCESHPESVLSHLFQQGYRRKLEYLADTTLQSWLHLLDRLPHLTAAEVLLVVPPHVAALPPPTDSTAPHTRLRELTLDLRCLALEDEVATYSLSAGRVLSGVIASCPVLTHLDLTRSPPVRGLFTEANAYEVLLPLESTLRILRLRLGAPPAECRFQRLSTLGRLHSLTRLRVDWPAWDEAELAAFRDGVRMAAVALDRPEHVSLIEDVFVGYGVLDEASAYGIAETFPRLRIFNPSRLHACTDPAFLHRFTQLTELRVVEVWHAHGGQPMAISGDQWASALQRATTVRHLYLDGLPKFTSEHLESALLAMPLLESLVLQNMRLVADSEVPARVPLPRLKRLSIADCFQQADQPPVLSPLRHLTAQLEQLRLYDSWCIKREVLETMDPKHARFDRLRWPQLQNMFNRHE